MLDELLQIERKITPILQEGGVLHASFFGSFVRGEANHQSDVDLLVELPKQINLLDLGRLKVRLEDAISRTVDLVEFSMLKPMFRTAVLREQKAIF